MRPFLTLLGLMVLAIAVIAILSSRHEAYSTAPLSEQPLRDDYKLKPPQTTRTTDPKDLKAFDQVKEGAVQATLEIEGRGVMTLELYPKAAPKTVAHFVDLCKSHFYDNILVHRVEPNFVFQAGDPLTKQLKPAQLAGKTSAEVADTYGLGQAGSGNTVPLEAVLPHKAFSVGLARAPDLDSGDSQFYINLKDNPDLDGQYCVFGRVIKGEDIASRVQIGDRIKRLSVP